MLGSICHGSERGRILHVHDRGVGETGSTTDCRRAGGQSGTSHPPSGGEKARGTETGIKPEMKTIMRNRPLMRLAVCLISMAAMILQSCSESGTPTATRSAERGPAWKADLTCWYTRKENAYKVTVFSRSGRTRRLKPQTYLLVEENGNLFVNTGYRVDVSYNEASGRADILTGRRLCKEGGTGMKAEERLILERHFLLGVTGGTRPMGGDRSRQPGPKYHKHVGQYRPYLKDGSQYGRKLCRDSKDLRAGQEILRPAEIGEQPDTGCPQGADTS